MYERFTDRARKVMQLANQEAHRWDDDHINTGPGVVASKSMNNPLAFERLISKTDSPQLLVINQTKDNPRYGLANAYARLLAGWRRISEKDRESIMDGISKG